MSIYLFDLCKPNKEWLNPDLICDTYIRQLDAKCFGE